ncbi:MAG: diaminopimelate epimerase [Myxococcota bacterium]
MHFEKWEGLGNDFVLVEEPIGAEQAALLCDRRRGVGADGVLILQRSEDADVPLRMVVLNADGSRPEMCGNGLRCAAAWFTARDTESRLRFGIATDAGPRACQVDVRQDTVFVGADMGHARVGEPYRYPAEGRSRRFIPVDVGNPHAVCLEPTESGELDDVGPHLEAHIQGGTNVELCRLLDPQTIEVEVWERGVGRTLACGTGACAVAAAAAAHEKAPFEAPIEVRLPGGALFVTVGPNFSLHMRGPARRVFVGEWSG